MASPASDSISSTGPSSVRIDRMQAKVPTVMSEIDREIDEHGLRAGFAVGRKADERVADVADRRVGHQPLDVALADGGEGAEQHRGDGEEHDDLLPLRARCRESPTADVRTSSAMAASFGAAAKNAVTGVGAPS